MGEVGTRNSFECHQILVGVYMRPEMMPLCQLYSLSNYHIWSTDYACHSQSYASGMLLLIGKLF